MVDPIHVPKPGAIQPGKSADKIDGATKSTDGGAAFHALIEQLADRARELEKTSAKPVDATELAGAVEEAHGSLKDALSLSAQLIEAYRASAMQPAPRDPSKP
jgi:hypothetical protein